MPRIPAPLLRPLSLAAVLAAALVAPVLAQETGADTAGATEPTRPKEPLPLWEIGVVAIAAYQPAYPGSDQDLARLRILPFGIYRGSLIRADGNGIGLRAFRSPRARRRRRVEGVGAGRGARRWFLGWSGAPADFRNAGPLYLAHSADLISGLRALYKFR